MQMKTGLLRKILVLCGLPLVAISLLVIAPTAMGDDPIITANKRPESSGQVATRVARAHAPVIQEIRYQATPPLPPADREKNIEEADSMGPAIPVDAAPEPPQTPETEIAQMRQPTTVNIVKNASVFSMPSGYTSLVDEPSVANNGNTLFYTGNWYAVRSTNAGGSYTFASPWNDFDNFCCDQDVIYSPKYKIFLWYRQGVADGSGENYFRLGVSNNNGKTWAFYNISPTDTNSDWAGEWWDYPQIGLTDNYLYICTNMFNAAGDFTRPAILRMPLQGLKQHGSFNYDYMAGEGHSTYTPVMGATNTMYWGTHVSNSMLTIYAWPENSTNVTHYDRSVPAYTYLTKNGKCPGPDKKNWCGRSDSRLLSGWVANGVIGFMWNAGKSSGFPFPYVNAATFRVSDMTYIGRPAIWNSKYAFQYAHVAPNSAGNLGISIFFGGGPYYPSHAIGVSTDGSSWGVLLSTANGTSGPGEPKWGDYVRVRPYMPTSTQQWIATGFTLQGSSSGDSIVPRYVIFNSR